MRLTTDLIAPSETATRQDHCPQCGVTATFVGQRVMVFTPGGARSMVLYGCTAHPLPEIVTDNPKEP